MYSLDHVVHYTKNPQKAVKQLNELGLHAVEGGEHPNWGTYNSLCYFDLSYIEFIGIRDVDVARNVTDNLLIERVVRQSEFGDGLSQIALRTDDMDKVIQDLNAKGFDVGERVPGKRTRKDRSVIEWQLLFPKMTSYDGPPLPFIIQWKGDDAERRIDLKAQGALDAHPAGSIELTQVGFAVENLEKRAAEWSEWFGLTPGEPFEDSELNATCQELHLNGGNLLFCEAKGAGSVADRLQNPGEHPFLITFSGTGEKKEISLLGALYRFKD